MTTTMSRTSNRKDHSTMSNYEDVVTEHISLVWNVDFDKKIISGSATLRVKVLKASSKLVLDTSAGLTVSAVEVDGTKTSHRMLPVSEHFGTPLEISLPTEKRAVGSVAHVRVSYATAPTASAVQWLPKEQTADKTHPYVFTQCQAIHARSLVPCQDAPSAKVTYDAVVRVPSWATALMSAVQTETHVEGDIAVFTYEQTVPIPTYLLALAAARLESRELSERCRAWSEPSQVDAVAFEFADTEKFLTLAEDLLSPYEWGRYDLLCLPPSFPYGGMENPCLTFVTPTLLAGDRSLADVVAHEIAHSWTGNLVTNHTWDHFWLNEGWTMWVQRKVMARIHGPDFFEFDAIGGWSALQDSVEHFGPDHSFSCLVPQLEGQDPDDAFSTVPYEKGFNFLYYLERCVGSKPFEAFAKAYIQRFRRSTLTTEDFREFFSAYFSVGGPGEAAARKPAVASALQGVDWATWCLTPGMPPVTPQFDQTLAAAANQLAEKWLAGQGDSCAGGDMEGWSTGQRVAMMDQLLAGVAAPRDPLPIHMLKRMDALYGLSGSRNSEIRHRWIQLALRSEAAFIVPQAVAFATEQGRMKFVRPTYRALFRSTVGRAAALDTFAQARSMYHPIAEKMLAQDLGVAEKVLAGSVGAASSTSPAVAAVAPPAPAAAAKPVAAAAAASAGNDKEGEEGVLQRYGLAILALGAVAVGTMMVLRRK